MKTLPKEGKQQGNKKVQAIDKEETIEKILRKEAEIKTLENSIQESKKEMDHIQKSQTWRTFGWMHTFLQKLYHLLGGKKVWKRKMYIQELEEELEETREKLLQQKEQIRNLYLENQTISSFQMMDFIRNIDEEGQLIDYLYEILEQKQTKDEHYNHALRYIARLFMNKEQRQKQWIYQKILATLKIEDIPEFMLREGLVKENPIPLKDVSSFRANLSIRLRQKQLVADLPEFILEDKLDGYYFVDLLNIRRPEIIAHKVTREQLPKEENVVLKPVDEAGARGVYLIHNFHDIIDVNRSRKIENWRALKESMKDDLASNRVTEDLWFMEELITEDEFSKKPARDLKFYCFYGQVGLILEIIRYPERKHCWWTASGKRIRTGKYEEDLFQGDGVSLEEVEQVEKLSSKIPAPFIRIDFLKTSNSFVFGEFTAKPGNYDEFDQETDQWLGDLYIEAQGRLMNDLVNGKKFHEFQQFKKSLGYYVSL